MSRSYLIQKKPSDQFLKLCQEHPCYVYLPWIETLTNKLIKQVAGSTTSFYLIPFIVFSDTQTAKQRKKIIFFTQYNKQHLTDIILAWLLPVAHQIRGFIFTFDYGLLQRQIIRVCQQLAIPTILIPHESVFFNRDKYYLHPLTGINSPLCDYVLCWGKLHKAIFTARGYPSCRINMVGAPKFDPYYNYQPQLTKQEFCKRAALNSNKPIILFAAQTLDFQVHPKLALSMQRKMINELMDYCQERDCEFILRYPPTDYPILDSNLTWQMKKANFLIDFPSPNYKFEPEEAIYHADIIISINSTLLFEALLMGKKTLSVKYFDFNEDWQRAGIKCVFNKEQLIETLTHWLDERSYIRPIPTAWAIDAFSLHGFDGQATRRITEFLKLTGLNSLGPIPLAIHRFIYDLKPPVDLVYFPDLSGPFSYIPHLLNAKTIITSKRHHLHHWVEINCQIRMKKSLNLNHKLPKVYIERGILCRDKQWTSILLDDLAYYNETNKTTRLQTCLESKLELTPDQRIEAEYCIHKMMSQQFPFEVTLPVKGEPIGRLGKPKILLIDEYVESSNSLMENYFKTMLKEAMNNYSDYDILIKPPAEIRKRQTTYLNQSILANYLKHQSNLYLINPCCDLYHLFSEIDCLFVVNSCLGFFGLMAGKTVYCYGSPFYANWGLTVDRANLVRPKRKRTFPELFYFTCIYLSRYYSPLLERKCNLIEYLDYVGIHQ